MPATSPPPRYYRPRAPGMAEKNGHHRLPLAEPAPDLGVFRTYAELLRWLAVWLLVLLALAALCSLLVLALFWLGAHLTGWLLSSASGGHGR